jgi:hypothetical protein
MSVIARSRGPSPTYVEAMSVSITETTFFEPSPSWTEQLKTRIAFLRQEYEGVTESVARYLQRNSDVAWTLIGAKPALTESFRGPVNVTLRLVRDPEEDDAEEHLFGYIQSELPVADALDALDRFDQSWLLDHMDMLSGRLDFDLGF